MVAETQTHCLAHFASPEELCWTDPELQMQFLAQLGLLLGVRSTGAELLTLCLAQPVVLQELRRIEAEPLKLCLAQHVALQEPCRTEVGPQTHGMTALPCRCCSSSGMPLWSTQQRLCTFPGPRRHSQEGQGP